jgi:hypothetical protein
MLWVFIGLIVAHETITTHVAEMSIKKDLKAGDKFIGSWYQGQPYMICDTTLYDSFYISLYIAKTSGADFYKLKGYGTDVLPTPETIPNVPSIVVDVLETRTYIIDERIEAHKITGRLAH